MATQPRLDPFPSGLVRCQRDERGRVLPMDPFERFREKCRFDPITGCVLWIGGTTRGHGNSAVYGSFKYEGKRWFAHRWAAVFIHGLDVGTDTVGHCCPHTPDGHPNTLCVEHLEVQTLRDNVVERNVRVAAARRAEQTNIQKRYWLFVQLGIEAAPPVHDPESLTFEDVPYFTPPTWLGNSGAHRGPIDCPF